MWGEGRPRGSWPRGCVCLTLTDVGDGSRIVAWWYWGKGLGSNPGNTPIAAHWYGGRGGCAGWAAIGGRGCGGPYGCGVPRWPPVGMGAGLG